MLLAPRSIVHRALFIGIPSGSLRGGPEAGGGRRQSREDRSRNAFWVNFLRSFYFAMLLARVASVSVRLQSKEQGTRFLQGNACYARYAAPLLNRVRWRDIFAYKHGHVNHHQNTPSSSDDEEEPTATG